MLIVEIISKIVISYAEIKKTVISKFMSHSILCILKEKATLLKNKD